jgi:hypothetical protein
VDTDFSDIRNYSLEDFSGVIVLRLKAQTKSQSNLVRQSGRATDFIRNKFFLNMTIAQSLGRTNFCRREMLEQIFKNLFSRKPVLPYPEGFKLKPGEEAIVVEFKQKIDPVFGRSLGQGS